MTATKMASVNGIKRSRVLCLMKMPGLPTILRIISQLSPIGSDLKSATGPRSFAYRLTGGPNVWPLPRLTVQVSSIRVLMHKSLSEPIINGIKWSQSSSMKVPGPLRTLSNISQLSPTEFDI